MSEDVWEGWSISKITKHKAELSRWRGKMLKNRSMTNNWPGSPMHVKEALLERQGSSANHGLSLQSQAIQPREIEDHGNERCGVRIDTF